VHEHSCATLGGSWLLLRKVVRGGGRHGESRFRPWFWRRGGGGRHQPKLGGSTPSCPHIHRQFGFHRLPLILLILHFRSFPCGTMADYLGLTLLLPPPSTSVSVCVSVCVSFSVSFPVSISVSILISGLRCWWRQRRGGSIRVVQASNIVEDIIICDDSG
jgi:hypothetical protein